MANNPQSNHVIPVIAVIIGVIGIFVTVAAFALVFSPSALKPTLAVVQPTSSPSSRYQPEIVPPLTYTPSSTQTATVTPTKTPAPTYTPTVTYTYPFVTQPLPDLTVTDISDPVCAPEFSSTTLRFTIYVRNIGPARTRSFGSFDIGVYLILGQSRYRLDEWAALFDGVVGTSKMEVSNLNPDRDIKFTVVVDLKGNKNFGIEAIANSGANPIREADTNNNTLLKYFSAYCY